MYIYISVRNGFMESKYTSFVLFGVSHYHMRTLFATSSEGHLQDN